MPLPDETLPQSLDESIESALNSQNSPAKEEETENTSPENEESETDEVAEENTLAEETQEIELTQEELSLLQKIRNPETRKSAIETLAKAEKIIEEKVSETSEKDKGTRPFTNSEKKQTIEEIAAEILGDEADLLPANFLKFFMKAIETKLEPIFQSQAQTAEQLAMSEINTSYSKLASDETLPGFVELEPVMNELSQDLPHKPGEGIEAYMRRLYKLPQKRTHSRK